MKYLITESQINKVIFKYLDNQDFVYMEYGINCYFLNSEKDEYAQIKLNSHRCTIDRKLMTEIASFFSLEHPSFLPLQHPFPSIANVAPAINNALTNKVIFFIVV